MLVPTAEIVARAAADGTGIAAFNVITLEHAEAIATGAELAGAPVIMQISQNAVAFHQRRLGPIAAATRAVAAGSSADVALHLDHVEDRELLEHAPANGFGSAMFDASTMEYEANVAATAAAADFCHRHGMWLEGELGAVGGKSTALGRGAPSQSRRPGSAHAPGVRTDPAEARAYVTSTGIDALAVAVGSTHAMTTRSASLDQELIVRLRDAVGVPLVLHGSSGVPDAELAAAVRNGMVKINIGTALNIAFSAEVRSFLESDARVVDPRKYLAPARDAMAAAVAHLLRVVRGK